MKKIRYVKHVKNASGIIEIVVLSLHGPFKVSWVRMQFWYQNIPIRLPKMHQNLVWEASWSRLGGLLGRLGSILRPLGGILEPLGRILVPLGPSWRRLGAQKSTACVESDPGGGCAGPPP